MKFIYRAPENFFGSQVEVIETGEDSMVKEKSPKDTAGWCDWCTTTYNETRAIGLGGAIMCLSASCGNGPNADFIKHGLHDELSKKLIDEVIDL